MNLNDSKAECAACQPQERQMMNMPKVELWDDPDDGICLGYSYDDTCWTIAAEQVEPKFAQLLLATLQRYFAEEATR